MTEREWLVSDDPTRMLAHLRKTTGHRKLRLFLCAFCRHFFSDKLTHPQYQHAVEVAEQYADGLAQRPDLLSAQRAALRVLPGPGRRTRSAHDAVRLATHGNSLAAAREVIETLAPDRLERTPRGTFIRRGEPRRKDLKEVCRILRDILGNPFHPATVDPAWLSWRRGTIGKLAQAVYDERAYDRLPILGDALEEAGCTDRDILGHCRGPGPHVRGCWVVDLLLGKK